jgi:acyl carrier protein
MDAESPDPAVRNLLEAWLLQHVAALLAMRKDHVDPSMRFERYGLDSAALVGMTGELADWLQCNVDPHLPYEHPSVEALSAALAQQAAVRAALAARLEHGRGGKDDVGEATA